MANLRSSRCLLYQRCSRPSHPLAPLAYASVSRFFLPHFEFQDTDSGRRQQQREVEFLVNFKRLHPVAVNIIQVIEARTAPIGMLLMRREQQTLTSMLEDASGVDVVAVEK